jgi:hypothetical protein
MTEEPGMLDLRRNRILPRSFRRVLTKSGSEKLDMWPAVVQHGDRTNRKMGDTMKIG